MKILCIIPPYVPSYFNAGHHLPVFQVATYLRQQGHDVTARDMGALNCSWADVCPLLMEGFDVIALLNDYDAIDGFPRFLEYVRELSPGSRLLTFGRGSRQVPAFFDRFSFDAVVVSGDYESGVAGYLDHLAGRPHAGGLRLKTQRGYADTVPGTLLEPERWAFPEIREIPYAAYERLYADDLRKFCGIPQRSELVVPVARGCSIGCSFCDVPAQQGLRERRVPVERAVDYIESSFAFLPFDYFSLYAPTFTLKRDWVVRFCGALTARVSQARWKCVTTTSHLDEELIERMGAAGCVRISVGIESTHDAAMAALPRVKALGNARIDVVERACGRAGIEINCFLMIGMPGEHLEAAEASARRLAAAGHRVRPTVYTPYDNMTPDMSVGEYARFNRQLLVHGGHEQAERACAYRFLYGRNWDQPTGVMNAIPIRCAEPEH